MPDALRSSGIQDFATTLRKSYGIRTHHRRRYRLCAQLALGGWQISRFNRAFDNYASKGGLAWAVPAGALNRGRGRHRPGRSATHRRHLVYERLTVFARPQKIPAITGMYAGVYSPM